MYCTCVLGASKCTHLQVHVKIVAYNGSIMGLSHPAVEESLAPERPSAGLGWLSAESAVDATIRRGGEGVGGVLALLPYLERRGWSASAETCCS
jgi:hypothetical protein